MMKMFYILMELAGFIFTTLGLIMTTECFIIGILVGIVGIILTYAMTILDKMDDDNEITIGNIKITYED